MKGQKTGNPSGKKQEESMPAFRFLPWVLLVITLVVYGQTLKFGFTWFDDDAILERNREYISGKGNIPDAITRDAEFQKKGIELYRPLQNVSFIADARTGGFSPRTFHFFSLLAHLFTCLVFFLLLRELGFSRPLSLLGTSLLALHPVFAFAVSWLPARGDLLLAFWSITAFWSFIRFLHYRKKYLLLLHIFAFAMSMFSKETGIITVALCLFYYLFIYPGRRWEKWQIFAVSGYVLTIVLYFYLRSLSIAGIRAGAFGLQPFIYSLQVLPEVILKFFIPFRIVTLPFYSLTRTLGGLVVIAVLVWLVVRQPGNKKLYLLAAGWFLGFTLPSMLYRPDWSDYIYDYLIHRSYLPLAGIVIMILLMLRRYESRLVKRPLSILSLSVLLLLAILSFNFTRVFASPLSFWEYSVRTNPASAFAWNYLGNAWFYNQDPAKAVESYDRAIGLKPDFFEAVMNRGITNASRRHHREAIEDFTRVLEAEPDDTSALRYRARSWIDLKDYARAVTDLQELIAKGDTSEKTAFQYALGSMLAKNFGRAQQIFDTLLERHPYNSQYLRISAIADLMNGNAERAVEKHLKDHSMVPPGQDALANLGYAFWEKGTYDSALECFEKADEMGDGDLSVNLGLLLCYHSLGRGRDLARVKEKVYLLFPELRSAPQGLEELGKEGYFFTGKQKTTLAAILKS